MSVYSVSFQYKRDGMWMWSLDHRVMASSPESAMLVWRHKGYGETRLMSAKVYK